MKKEMMKRIGMPSAKKPEMEMEMEFEPSEMEESEMPAEEGMEMEAESEAAAPLAEMADEDILKELEARGYDVSMLGEPMSEEEAPAEEEAPMPPKAKGKLPA